MLILRPALPVTNSGLNCAPEVDQFRRAQVGHFWRAPRKPACPLSVLETCQFATNRAQSRTNPARRTPSIRFEPRGVVAELLLSRLSPQRGQLPDVQAV